MFDRRDGQFKDYVSDSSSPARDYPAPRGGYLNHFSRKLGDLSAQVYDRAKEMQNNTTNTLNSFFGLDKDFKEPTIATRDFWVHENGTAHWKGLPLPRTEYLPNGDEYYMFLDKDNLVNILDNKIHTNSLDLVNPLTNISIGRKPLDVLEMAKIRSCKTVKAYFEAPKDSYIYNIHTSNLGDLSRPNLESTSITGELPSYDKKPSIPIDIPSMTPEKGAFARWDYIEFDEVDIGATRRATTYAPISQDTASGPYNRLDGMSSDSTPRAAAPTLVSPDATPRPVYSRLPGMELDSTPRATTSQLPANTDNSPVIIPASAESGQAPSELPDILGGWPQANPAPDTTGRIDTPDVFDDPFDPYC